MASILSCLASLLPQTKRRQHFKEHEAEYASNFAALREENAKRVRRLSMNGSVHQLSPEQLRQLRGGDDSDSSPPDVPELPNGVNAGRACRDSSDNESGASEGSTQYGEGLTGKLPSYDDVIGGTTTVGNNDNRMSNTSFMTGGHTQNAAWPAYGAYQHDGAYRPPGAARELRLTAVA